MSQNNLNINVPENPNAILRLEVELRDKYARRANKPKTAPLVDINTNKENVNAFIVPMEKVKSISNIKEIE
jgi:hypothetical protein